MDKYTELLFKVMRGESSSNTALTFPTKQNVPVPPQTPQATTQRTTTYAKGKAVVPTHDRQRYREFTRQGYQQALKDNAGARFHAGFMEGLSPVSLGLESEALEGSKAFLAGNIAGTMAQFAIPYAGVAPKIGKALSNVPKYAQMGKVGQAVARGVGTDLAVGVPLNTLYGVSKEGLEGKELAKFIGLNTAIDLIAGGVLEVIGGVLLKSGKRVATKAEFDALSKAEQAEVLEEVSKREIVRRQLKQQDRTIETISEVPTKPEIYTKIEKEVKANVNKLLAGAKPELRKEVRDLIPSFVKGETSVDDFIQSVYDAAVSIPYAKAGDKELLAGVRAFLKKGIKVTDDLRQIPDFKDFRIANAGKIKFSPNGSYVDVLYEELADMYGNVFPRTITNPVDQLERIISVLDGNKAETIRLGDVLTESQIYDEVVYPVLDEVNDLLSLSKTRVKGTETVKGFPRYKLDTPVKPLNRPVQPRTPQGRATVPNKSIGADISRPQKTSEELIQEYGLIKPGMEPKAREARIPKATDAGDVQLGIRTSAEAKAINEQSYKEIQSAVEEGMATKFTVTNEKAVAEANKKIADNGLEKAHDEFRGFMQSGKMPKSKDIALGYRLMQEYQKAGDYKKVAELAIDISELLSETGRSLQAAQIIKKLSPEGRVMSVQRVAKKLSEKFDVDVKLDEATIKKVRQAKTEKEIVEATEEAAIKAWNQVPSGLQNKLNAWRYIAMLFNPVTHVRNIVGNAIFMPARELKNLIGAGLEKAIVPVGKRTKAVINPASKADRELLKFADKDFDNVVNILRGEGKFDEGYRKLEANVFKNKILEGLRVFNMKALDVEDIWFMRAAYDSSMAQYLKANNINTKSITDELLQKARNYAADEALKATYRDANTVATAISKLKRKLATNKTDNTGLWLAQRAGGIALEGVLPFTKTPTNILRRGFEYSPFSIIAGIGDVIKVARKGGDMAKALDRLATGLSGTSILLIGALAGKNQWVVGGSDDLYSSKQYQYSNMQGMQEYAIDTGEGTYTIDWAAPMSMPFFVGVELGKFFEKEGADFSKVVDAITKIDDPLFNMSMLQGINDALNSWGYGDDAIGQIASNMMISYLGQYVPTVGGQIARTVDDTRRTTTSTAESPTKRKLEKALNRQLGKIPLAIAYRKNEPYIDLWGRTETSGSAVENFISPGYYRPKNVTFVDKEINKLIERLDEETAKEVIPRVTNSYTVTQDKVEYRMTEKELTQFKKTRGQTSYKELERLFRSGQYARMSDAEKVKAIRKIYDKAFQKAKEELLRKRASIPIKK